MTTYELVQYYAKLLILQYINKPKAAATVAAQASPVLMPPTSVQVLTFSAVADSGTFILYYRDNGSAPINWDDDATAIQTKLRAVPRLDAVTVTGSIASQTLTITFDGVPPPADPVSADSSLWASTTAVDISIEETDVIMPLAVQGGYNLVGDSIAAGAQLDVIGKYAGVARSGLGFTGYVTLSDADFLSLIRLAIIKNNSGSSLATIQDLLHTFFPGQILVFDYQNMRLSYIISQDVGSLDLIQLFITENLLPKPMAVGMSLVIYAPDITNFFGFRTYESPAFNAKPFNSYADYQTDWPWLSYAYAISF